MKTKAKDQSRPVLVANKSYGLYIGYTTDTHEQIAGSASIRVTRCRHVCSWHGRTGGITSLAAHGPCGPRAKESLIGAEAADESTLTGVVNVFPLSPEAVAAFDAIQPS